MTTVHKIAAHEIAVHYASIELDNGENLLDLDLGQAVELRADTKHPGLWVLVALRDEDGLVRLQAGADIEDCASAGVGCRFSGTSAHAHPVDADGRLLELPGRRVTALEPPPSDEPDTPC